MLTSKPNDKDPAGALPALTRKPHDMDFVVELPGVGSFRYGRRTYGDRIRIRAAYLRLLGMPDDDQVDDDLAAMCAIVAAHGVLCVEAPAGWEDLSAIDLVADPENEGRILDLYARMKQKEGSFRRGATSNSAPAGV